MDLYKQLGWVYASVKAIARAGAGLPVKLYERTGDKPEDRKELTTHKVLNLFHHVNSEETFPDFIEGSLVNLMLA